VALPIARHVQDREWRLISNRVKRMVREHGEVTKGDMYDVRNGPFQKYTGFLCSSDAILRQ
jgi:hypothetical protein